MRFAIYARDHFRCIYCRHKLAIDGRGATIDHVRPRRDGGSHTPDNLVTACKRCNSSKQARSLQGRDKRNVRARVRRATSRPVNRDLGRWLEKALRGR